MKKHLAFLVRRIYLPSIFYNDLALEQKVRLNSRSVCLMFSLSLMGQRDKNYAQLRKSRLEASSRKNTTPFRKSPIRDP